MVTDSTNPEKRICFQLSAGVKDKLDQVKEHLAKHGFDLRQHSLALRAALLAVPLDSKLVEAAEADAENDRRLRYSKKVTKTP